MLKDNLMTMVMAAALVASALVQIWLAWITYRTQKTPAPISPGPHDSAVKAQLKALDGMMADFERRFARLHQPIHAPSPAREPAYEIAINLARKGAGLDEVMSTCDLTRAEAELMLHIYRKPAEASNAHGRIAA